jgi:hypothetical protein
MKKRFRDSIRMLICTIFIVMFSLNSYAQKRVSGTVSTEDGSPLAGVTIAVKGTTQGVLTDADGYFSLDVRNEDVLVISYVGYITQEVPVAGKTSLIITLAEDVLQLGDIVVVGYATGSKRSISGAVDLISIEDMNAG